MIKFLKEKVLDIDYILLFFLVIVLIIHYLNFLNKPVDGLVLLFFAIIATLPVVYSSFLSLKNKKISVDLLASAALIFSLLAKEWTSAIFINLMLTSARIFLEYNEGKARQNIESLLKLKPKVAKIKKGSEIIEIPINKIKKGDLVAAELGERISVDGIIEEGEASVDQSSLTGESLPVAKSKGDSVLSSSMVVSGSLLIKAEKVGKETTLEKIIELVERAQKNKAEINTLSEKFTGYYIGLTFLGAAVIYFIFGNLSLVLSVMLVVCADDIAVAIPLAFLSAISFAAKRGIIIKGGNFLEGVKNVKVVIVDKTGTLTRGKLKVHDFYIFNKNKESDFFILSGMITALSSHPASKAIAHFIKEKNIKLNDPERFEEFSGKGATALYGGKKLIIGRESFLEDLDIKFTQEEINKIKEEKDKGFSLSFIAYDDNLVGFFALADEIKPQIGLSIEKLKKLGVEKIIMLTGDNEKIAKRVADAVGIEEFYANLMPEDKINYLKKYLSDDYKVMMIGDGMNDAAALSLADIGIAMGGIGYDVAIESADIVLMKDDFSKIPELFNLSNYVVKIAKSDFLIWGAVNFLGLVLVFGGVLNPVGAAAYNFLTDFLPLFNSMRIFKMYLKK